MAGKGKRDGAPIIVIKKIEEGGHGHHGGAWKVAYADFVTAMMAFFLLMWLLNATSEEQRRGLADYFAPTNVLGRSNTGSGQPFCGRSPNSDGKLATDTGAIRAERGALRSSKAATETEMRLAGFEEIEGGPRQALPISRLLLHYRVGFPRLAKARSVRALLARTERLAEHLVPPSMWAYFLLRGKRSAG